ncbi:hypothetical protein ACHAWF_015663 [Thalassiosira exigua]
MGGTETEGSGSGDRGQVRGRRASKSTQHHEVQRLSTPVLSGSGGANRKPTPRNARWKIAVAALPLFLFATRSIIWTQSVDSGIMQAHPMVNNVSAFMVHFQDILLNDTLDTLYTNLDTPFVPLVWEYGKLLCRKPHMKQLSTFKIRTRSFTQMVRQGLGPEEHRAYNLSSSLPVMIMEGDFNGCDIRSKSSQYDWPRLHWSQLAPDRGDYCEGVIGMPSYETWRYFQLSERGWENYFRKNEKKYPWSKKIVKAVWRGATTYEASQYANSELGETPRGRLVDISAKRPDLLDAAFHKILQKFGPHKKKLKQQFTVSKRIVLRDMMKYQAIIDVDGNNWSSRFGMLLCSNSVVIKIDPGESQFAYCILL